MGTKPLLISAIALLSLDLAMHCAPVRSGRTSPRRRMRQIEISVTGEKCREPTITLDDLYGGRCKHTIRDIDNAISDANGIIREWNRYIGLLEAHKLEDRTYLKEHILDEEQLREKYKFDEADDVKNAKYEAKEAQKAKRANVHFKKGMEKMMADVRAGINRSVHETIDQFAKDLNLDGVRPPKRWWSRWFSLTPRSSLYPLNRLKKYNYGKTVMRLLMNKLRGRIDQSFFNEVRDTIIEDLVFKNNDDGVLEYFFNYAEVGPILKPLITKCAGLTLPERGIKRGRVVPFVARFGAKLIQYFPNETIKALSKTDLPVLGRCHVMIKNYIESEISAKINYLMDAMETEYNQIKEYDSNFFGTTQRQRQLERDAEKAARQKRKEAIAAAEAAQQGVGQALMQVARGLKDIVAGTFGAAWHTGAASVDGAAAAARYAQEKVVPDRVRNGVKGAWKKTKNLGSGFSEWLGWTWPSSWTSKQKPEPAAPAQKPKSYESAPAGPRSTSSRHVYQDRGAIKQHQTVTYEDDYLSETESSSNLENESESAVSSMSALESDSDEATPPPKTYGLPRAMVWCDKHTCWKKHNGRGWACDECNGTWRKKYGNY